MPSAGREENGLEDLGGKSAGEKAGLVLNGEQAASGEDHHEHNDGRLTACHGVPDLGPRV
jgi:hypothetical protein